ncbi:MAG: metallophosphoesterase [Zymomonas mobilis]|uniref:Calcineurin-like phosphoesterase family protein n=1 Tax=Zymomonas mobilis TaxID=542 RepID=A0A542VZB5_ZYMMB|nr:metallophosphoesterase [Zymomonas mobilis]TQL16666.1 calcineurin-like phosphoesterase family protein [Zymomonas mobilis]
MLHFNRRSFLSLSAGATLAAAATTTTRLHAGVPNRPPLRDHESFSFLFITDTHLEPELNGAQGCHEAFIKARSFPADFAIHGGDHVFDALGVNAGRASMLADLYHKTADDLRMPVHHTMGNHDCFGIYKESGAQPTDPFYGKKYFEDNFGQIYYSFDHKGVHFVILDSIGITEDRSYEGRIDPAQFNWLSRDLAAQPAGTPIIVSSHIPIMNAIDYASIPLNKMKHHSLSVINAADILELFDHYNVIGVFQGHTHVVERIEWHGVPYITGGSVCGNWWHGTRYGTPEGFMVVKVKNGKVIPHYETYGFQTIDPHNT